MRGRDIFRIVGPGLLILSRALRLLPSSVRYAVLAVFRGTPGWIGLGIRYAAVRSLARSCGDNVYIGPYCFLSFLENCDLGSNISIREFASIGCRGNLRIGDNVSLAYGAVVLTTEHGYQDSSKLIRDAPIVPKETIIQDDVWVGARVVITAGVTIGRGTVVGAGAVVTKSIPPSSIAVGVPARVVSQRQGISSEEWAED